MQCLDMRVEFEGRFSALKYEWFWYNSRDGLAKCTSCQNGLLYKYCHFRGNKWGQGKIKGEGIIIPNSLVLVITTRKLIQKGCEAFLSYVVDTKKKVWR
jgi:hypothetical protein